MRSHHLFWKPGTLTVCARRIRVAEGLAAIALLCLAIHVFMPVGGLQIAGIFLLSGASLACWSAVLAWRFPVLSNRRILFLGFTWAAGLAGGILLARWAGGAHHPLALRVAADLLAASLSLCVGALFFRALFWKRTTPWLVRALSLLSPVAVLVLILLQLVD